MKAVYLYDHGSVEVEYADCPGVQDILREMFEEDTYRLKELKKSGYDVRLCLDVGAYMGFFGKLVHYHWPQAKVLAFEPNADLCDYIRINGSDVIFNNAVRYDGKSEFWVSEYPSGSVIYDPTVNFSEEITNKYQKRTVIPLRFEDAVVGNFINGNRIDLLKIDCEGSEFDILCGISPNIRSLIRRIIGEYHHISGYRFVEQIISLRYPHLTPKLLDSDPLKTIANFEAFEKTG